MGGASIPFSGASFQAKQYHLLHQTKPFTISPHHSLSFSFLPHLPQTSTCPISLSLSLNSFPSLGHAPMLKSEKKFDLDMESQDGFAFAGILEIHVHHARNIHNICIYEKQDVYAKFSLTYNPDETFSTRVINGGGKNPDFNHDLIINITQPKAVLKCEIWMLSRAKNFMDDQLLGFVLVPLSSLSGKGRLTQDFSLSSTDLFPSPAGTIKLSLFLNAKTPTAAAADSPPHSSATSQLLLDKATPEDYCRIEFPDVNVADQNRRMVSEYFAENGAPLRPWLEMPDGSFLHLGVHPSAEEDYDMAAANSSDAGSVSPDQNSGFLSSTVTCLSDDRNSADSMEKKGLAFADLSTENAGAPRKSDQQKKVVEKETAARSVKVEAEESAMQQQIVDMYMRSMQQFTESLAKMKLPMGGAAAAAEEEEEGDLIEEKIEVEKNKKDKCRVFYGSRAFF